MPSSRVRFDHRGQMRRPALQSGWRGLTTPLQHTTLQTTDCETKEATASFLWAIWANSWWRLLKISAAHHQRSLARREREQAERRKKVKNKKKAIEHFSHLADIVVCLFVGRAGGVEECCIQEWIIGSAHQHRYAITCSTGTAHIKDHLSRILFIRAWIRWLENPRILCHVEDVEWMVIVFHRCRC